MNEETKYEYLKSYFKKYTKLHEGCLMSFVTIQPLNVCWTPEDAYNYLNSLFPNLSCVIQLEQNYEKKYHSARMQDGLHIHLLAANEYLIPFKDKIIYYDSKRNLCQINRNMKCQNLHVVARPVFDDELPSYLHKQNNSILPQLIL